MKNLDTEKRLQALEEYCDALSENVRSIFRVIKMLNKHDKSLESKYDTLLDILKHIESLMSKQDFELDKDNPNKDIIYN